MKIYIIVTLLVFLMFGCASKPTPFYAKESVFSIGTYQEGSNITEPHPKESRYLRTNSGGFQLIQSFAAYKVFIDVIRKPEKRYYTRAIIQNPLDSNAPFVYEHYIDPDTPSTILTHGPVKGLQIYKDYTVELILYEDKNRTKEIDRLTQKIRCYVDTTSNQLFLYHRMKGKNL
jgi:hypothetical protein